MWPEQDKPLSSFLLVAGRRDNRNTGIRCLSAVWQSVTSQGRVLGRAVRLGLWGDVGFELRLEGCGRPGVKGRDSSGFSQPKSSQGEGRTWDSCAHGLPSCGRKGAGWVQEEPALSWVQWHLSWGAATRAPWPGVRTALWPASVFLRVIMPGAGCYQQAPLRPGLCLPWRLGRYPQHPSSPGRRQHPCSLAQRAGRRRCL